MVVLDFGAHDRAGIDLGGDGGLDHRPKSSGSLATADDVREDGAEALHHGAKFRGQARIGVERFDHQSHDEAAMVALGRMVEANTFVADIAKARAEGSCMTNGLSDRFICCLAAPIRDRRGIAVATLCFIVPIDSSPERKRELLNRLVESAQELSDRPAAC